MEVKLKCDSKHLKIKSVLSKISYGETWYIVTYSLHMLHHVHVELYVWEDVVCAYQNLN